MKELHRLQVLTRIAERRLTRWRAAGLLRAVSDARFEIARRTETSPVVLGECDDAPLLGAVTLETLGLMVNPLTREVRPMGRLPMYRALGAARASRP